MFAIVPFPLFVTWLHRPGFSLKAYQEMLSKQNLANDLIEQKMISSSDDPGEMGKQLTEYKNALYEIELGGKVKILNPNVQLQ